MTEAHESHLNSLITAFTEAVIAKYERGQQEHGGNLWEYPVEQLLDEAINEAIDQFVYLATVKQKLKADKFVLPPVED